MFGFRPEPIAIPTTGAASSSLELPINQPAAANPPPQVAPIQTNHVAVAPIQTHAAAAAAASALEPLEQVLGAASSEIQHTDLQVLHNIGHGSSGIVQKVLHVPSDSVLALKIIPVEADEVKRKQILLELKALHEAAHPSVVSFYGAFYREGAVHVALEYMDASLLDISRGVGAALPEDLLAAIAQPVLSGLVYMHREKHIIHRDIKPSNLLVDSSGNVKIADFGVSGELHHTLAKCASWVGTVHYMSPERIQGGSYSYDSDVWSFGITMLELATAAFPYPPERGGRRLSFWDLLDAIVESPPPTPPPHFGQPFHHLITACLQKEPSARATSTQLLHHPFITQLQQRPVDLAGWLREALAKLPQRGLADEDEGAGSTELMGSGNNNGHSGQNGSSSSFAVNCGGLGDTLGASSSGGGGGGFVLGGVPPNAFAANASAESGMGSTMDAKSAAMLAGLMGGGTVQGGPSPQAPPQPPAGEDAMEMD